MLVRDVPLIKECFDRLQWSNSDRYLMIDGEVGCLLGVLKDWTGLGWYGDVPLLLDGEDCQGG